VDSFLRGFPLKPRTLFLLSHAYHTPRPSHSPSLHLPNDTWGWEQILKSSLCNYLHSYVTSSPLGPNILKPLFSKTLSLCFSLNVRGQILHPYKTTGSRVSSGSIVSDYGLDDRAIGRSGFDPRQGQRSFPLASMSRPALGPTQPPVQWVLEVLSPGVKGGRGVMLTTHPHLVPRSRMSRSYTSSPPKRLHGV
jgi:hypothetical protein